ncbi:unnamed protein product [Acanthoscelides obtectus]|uniref:HTH psq-type domain-containing protein n=1 Tax=Acanthoscelides obtectus TaxID=200917 RepID=A0A9P0L6Y4_ACAOB|nr:unnamed protein product [Acanthoscelides obtectus]CAK1630847.1 hypothetical protein AOBTE_LOCUS6585 [Acanthoscelides obtectus]
MGRYKRVIGSRNYSNYTTAQLEEALRLIISGVISQRQCSTRFKIPRATLKNKLKGVHNRPEGGQAVLSVEEEKKI